LNGNQAVLSLTFSVFCSHHDYKLAQLMRTPCCSCGAYRLQESSRSHF